MYLIVIFLKINCYIWINICRLKDKVLLFLFYIISCYCKLNEENNYEKRGKNIIMIIIEEESVCD